MACKSEEGETNMDPPDDHNSSNMARVTVFSVDDCRHCARAKAALTQRDVPYVEINLNHYPERRVDMLSLTDRLTVPQIFFENRHVGGADETLELIEKWDKQKLNPLDRFKRKNATRAPWLSVDKRLSKPTTPPVPPPTPPPRDRTLVIELPQGRGRASVLDVTEVMIENLPRADLPWRARVYKDSFLGRDGVLAIMQYYKLSDKESAISFGRSLQRHRILHHVTGDNHAFGFNDYYFRLQPYQQPNVLNTFRVWTERVDPDSMGLLSRLKKMLGKIVSASTGKDGLPDYILAASTPDYLVFEEAVCELQNVSMGNMGEKTKLAFAINLYNLMIIHAFIKVGVPKTAEQRSGFYGSISYNVGGDILTFDVLEHGIIRANSRPPYQVNAPLSKADPRIRLSLNRVDPRIHFALNCGAKSCPPVKNFTAVGVKEELRIVAEAFCESDENVSIDEGKSKLSLSMILSWYRADFASSTSKLPNVIVDFLRGKRKDKLQRMIDSGKPISISFKKYDWKPLASRYNTFETNKIDPNEVTIKAFMGGPSCTSELVIY